MKDYIIIQYFSLHSTIIKIRWRLSIFLLVCYSTTQQSIAYFADKGRSAKYTLYTLTQNTLAEQMRFYHNQKVQKCGTTPDHYGRIPKTGGNTDAELLTRSGVGRIVPRILYEELEGGIGPVAAVTQISKYNKIYYSIT